MKKILIVAAEFPPSANPGVYRVLKLCNMLRGYGWQPIILTMKDESYGRIDSSLVIDHELKEWIFRSTALDAQIDLALCGKYFEWQCIPDRWWPWIFSSVSLGKKLINKFKPDLIWSTYPYATTHYIALKLSAWSNIPWIADYRDPMRYLYNQEVSLVSKINRALDKKVIEQCTKAVFATHEAQELYENIYNKKKHKYFVIENGFDEDKFINVTKVKIIEKRPFILLHSGNLYGGNGRNPVPLFDAIQKLKAKGIINPKTFKLWFRGENIDSFYADIKRLDIEDFIEFLPSITFAESLSEMLSVDALLVIQGGVFNYQIPGKIYEYLRSGKALLAMTPKNSATAKVLEGINGVYTGDTKSDLAIILEKIINKGPQDELKRNISEFSREERTKAYIQLLNNTVEKQTQENIDLY